MKHKILIVDDDASILEALTVVVESSGYQAIPATCGQQVLPLVETYYPSLIILDIKLPDGDGRQISRKIKKHPHFKNIPIILMSAHIPRSYISAETFIEKPLDINRLIAAVHSLITYPKPLMQ